MRIGAPTNIDMKSLPVHIVSDVKVIYSCFLPSSFLLFSSLLYSSVLCRTHLRYEEVSPHH